MKSKKSKPRVFENPFLEKLTESNIYIHIVFYGGLVALYAAISLNISQLLWWQNLLVFTGAVFFWTLAEYLLHRYVFHIAERTKFTRRLQYMLHGVHHEEPKGKIFMPPIAGLIISFLFFCFFWSVFWLAGNPSLTWIFTSGFIMGSVIYSLIHYGTHKVKPP
jgi:hypothetical protein